MLQSVLDEQKNASRNVLRIIETISKHNNTPRKKPKFINFVKNVCGLKTNPKDIDQAWDLISVKLSALSNMNARNGNKNAKDETKVNGANDEENKTDTQNGDVVNDKLDVGNEEQKNIEEDKNAEEENGEVKKEVKLSKKQRKEEKKRLKYEAELQSAEAPPEDDTQDEVEVQKKGKKNKNKVTNGVPSVEDDSDKIKKRKRQDTVSITEVSEPEVVVESVTVKEKASKKKIKMEKLEKEAEDVCLHDQNVASTESEVANKNGKFNWHEVILSVLQKKGNELPFKRLQKKVLSEYTELTGCEVDDRIADKFIKKLKSAPRVRVDKNRVILLEE